MFGLFESLEVAESARALFASEWTSISRFTSPL
jgi:hypothetical protein